VCCSCKSYLAPESSYLHELADGLRALDNENFNDNYKFKSLTYVDIQKQYRRVSLTYESCPTHQAPEGSDLHKVADEIRALGNEKFKAGEYAKAIQKYEKALRYIDQVTDS